MDIYIEISCTCAINTPECPIYSFSCSLRRLAGRQDLLLKEYGRTGLYFEALWEEKLGSSEDVYAFTVPR